MKVFDRTQVQISPITRTEISGVIEQSLRSITTQENQFIINDTPWFAINRKNNVTPCVINSASFISKKFQSNLGDFANWRGESKFDNQNFDGYGEVVNQNIAYMLPEENFIKFLKIYLQITNQPEFLIAKYFSIFFGMYVKRKIFSLDHIPSELHEFFTPVESHGPLRVGVEFETGNIGSSFRALLKLNNLFLKNFIDVGVFITSINKEDCATRIWPVSNRNGSFSELESRNFRDNVTLPLIEYGFAPDSFSPDADYLGEKGILFQPTRTNKVLEFKKTKFHVYRGENDDEILLPDAETPYRYGNFSKTDEKVNDEINSFF